MNFPSVPTDSLYKFMAIAGVAFVIAANALTSQSMVSMQELRSKERQASEDRVVEAGWRIVDDVRKDHEDKAERTRELKSLEPLMAQARNLELTKLQARLKEIDDETKTLTYMLKIMERIGFVFAPVGFFLWWYLIQRYQDGILRSQHKKECSETASTKK